jgi:hypothetical protein
MRETSLFLDFAEPFCEHDRYFAENILNLYIVRIFEGILRHIKTFRPNLDDECRIKINIDFFK